MLVKAFEEADGLLDKLSATDSTSFAPAAPTPAIVATPPVVLESTPTTSTDAVVDAVTNTPPEAVSTPAVDQVTSTASDLTTSFGDLSIVPIAVGVLVVIAALALLGSGDGEQATSPAPPASPSGATDLSIPYDAAARLAYEKAGSPGDYASFKAKYEADAVAEVKAKQKQ